MFNSLLPGQSNQSKEFSTGLIKIREKTMVIGNSIYYIPNISALEVADLSSIKPTPIIVWLLVLGGIFLQFFVVDSAKALGILLILIAIGVYLYNREYGRNIQFGLRIILNSGLIGAPILISDDQEFLNTIALTIYNIMNGREVQSVSFSFDQRQIIDMNNISGSTLVVGNVTGDIVNNV